MYFLRKHIDEASIYQDRQSQVKAGGCKRPRPAPTLALIHLSAPTSLQLLS